MIFGIRGPSSADFTPLGLLYSKVCPKTANPKTQEIQTSNRFSHIPSFRRTRLGTPSLEDAALALNTEFLVFLDQHVLVQGPIRHAPAMGSTGSTGTIGSYAAWGLEERRSMVLAEEMTSLGQERVPWPAGG